MLGFVLAALMLALAGCAETSVPPGDVLARFEPWSDTAQEYRLRPGDEIDVKLIYNPELSDRVVVGPDGQISMALVGFVPAAGRTPAELQADLRARLARELRRPEVNVVPRGFASRKVFVGGEVERPGMYDLPGQMGVLQAVTVAGGFKPTAAEDKVVLIRRTPRNTPMMRTVDAEAIYRTGALNEDEPLKPFDIVYVPRSDIAEVGLFVDLYIRKLLPVEPGVGYSIN